MAFGSGNDTEIKVIVDANGAIQTLDKVENKITEVGGATAKTESVFTTFNQALEGLQKVGNFAAGAVQKLMDGMSRGSDVEDVTEAFNQFARAAGASSDVLLNQLQQATANTISNFDLMKKGVDNLRAGLTPEQFIAVAKAARVLAEQGSDLTTEFNDLSQALITGQDKLLKRKGILIDTTAEQNKATNALKAQGKVLTETDIQLIQRNAITEQYLKIGAASNTITEDAGDRVNQLGAALSNAKDRFTETLSSNGDLNIALGTLKSIVENIDWGIVNTAVSELGKNVSALVVVINDGLMPAVKEADRWMTGLADIIHSNLTPEGRKLAAEIERLEKKVGENNQVIMEGTATAGEHAKALAKVEEAGKKNTAQINKGIKGTVDQNAVVEAAKKKQAQLAEQFKKSTEALEKHKQQVATLNSPQGIAGLRDKLTELFKLQQEGVIPSVSALTEEMIKLRTAALDAGTSMESFGAASELALSDINAQLNEGAFDFTKSIDAALASAVTSLANGDFEGALRGSLGGLGGDLGTSIGESFGLGQLGGALGAALGDAVGKGILDGIESVFGGREAQGAMRDSMDRFFADVFKDNPFQVALENSIAQISDLEFGRGTDIFNSGTFDDLLASLPAKIQEGFSAAGAAFETFFEGSEEIAGQLAAVLTNNLGGSLNNLQILIEATGYSFEQLRDQVVEAFLDGEFTIEQAALALRGLQDLAESGIPGALGAVDQAFNNLSLALKDGGKNGRLVVDSIGDIGAEAQKLGLKTLPELAQSMINTFGFSADVVAAFMESLRVAGIQTLDQLTDASANAAVNIAANFQAIQGGGAATFTTPADLVTNEKAPTPSRSSAASSTNNRAEERKRERQQQLQDLRRLVESSIDYKAITQSVSAGLLEQSQASSIINSLYKQGRELTHALAQAEKQYNKELRSGKGIKDDTIKAFEQASTAMDEFAGKEAKRQTINEGLLEFTKQFAGNLNAIELAAKAAGVSLKGMAGDATSAFLAGKITALDARNKANTSVGTGFANLKQFGTRGGALSVDALRDIATEALRSGSRSFDELIAQAQGQGVARSDIQKLMIALQNEGITTLDQLKGLSDETAINVLAGLQEIAFPFEQTSDAVLQLLDDLDKIPDSKQIDLVLNIRSGAIDDQTKAVLDALGIDVDSIAPGYGAGADSPGINTPGGGRRRGKRNKRRRSGGQASL